MKRIFICLFLSLSLQISAQENSAFRKFFKTFSGRDGYTTIDVSSALLRTMMIAVDDENDDELYQLVNSIKAVRVVICHDPDKEFKNSLEKLLNQNDYTLVSSVNENKNSTSFYQLYDKDKIVEFMMVANGEEEKTVVNITGNIDIQKIANFSHLNFPNADSLSIKP